jgi:hypothetical protein
MTVKEATAAIRAAGCTLAKQDGEYRVRVLGAAAGEGYYTTDLDDAVETAWAMGPGGKGARS